MYADLYRKIKEKDIGVDMAKLHMFFEKTVEPYYYWVQEHKEQPKTENPAAMLEAIKKKYKLQITKDGFKLPGFLGSEEFRILADKMRAVGYKYSRESQEFLKVVRQ